MSNVSNELSGASSQSAITSSKSNDWVLDVSNLKKSVPLEDSLTLDILKGVGLSLKRGSSLAIVGRSGSGKTTLLGLLAGLDVATEGTVKLLGCDLGKLNEDERADLRARHVGFVFQSFQLLPTLTALDNVALPLELQGVSTAEQKAKIILDNLGLSERIDHFPAQMSGGEQQRVALARAFASEPDILFADEPTGNLDSQTGADIINALFDRNQSKGTSLVLVTHDMNLANQCEHIVHIQDGRVLKTETGLALNDGRLEDAADADVNKGQLA